MLGFGVFLHGVLGEIFLVLYFSRHEHNMASRKGKRKKDNPRLEMKVDSIGRPSLMLRDGVQQRPEEVREIRNKQSRSLSELAAAAQEVEDSQQRAQRIAQEQERERRLKKINYLQKQTVAAAKFVDESTEKRFGVAAEVEMDPATFSIREVEDVISRDGFYENRGRSVIYSIKGKVRLGSDEDIELDAEYAVIETDYGTIGGHRAVGYVAAHSYKGLPVKDAKELYDAVQAGGQSIFQKLRKRWRPEPMYPGSYRPEKV